MGIPDHVHMKVGQSWCDRFPTATPEYRQKHPILVLFLNCRGCFSRHIGNPNYLLQHLTLLRCITTQTKFDL